MNDEKGYNGNIMRMEGKKLLIDENRFGTYGIRFHDTSKKDTANIWSIGLEKQTSTTYDWDGRNRKEEDVYVFQYTLSGKGVIEAEGRLFVLKPGDGFFVHIPGDHRYYLPEYAEGPWIFIYITLFGTEAAACWHAIYEQAGMIVSIPKEKTVIQKLFHLYEQVQREEMTDMYTASARAYEFLMECRRYIYDMDAPRAELPPAILRALDYMASHYYETMGLEDCAQAAGLSKYHFNRKFREYTGLTPSQYITKQRIERAVELLHSTSFSVKEIAAKVGYADANYFHKVFRKYVGTSPVELRKGEIIPPMDRLFIH